MPMNGGDIRFNVDLQVKKNAGISQLIKSLQDVQNQVNKLSNSTPIKAEQFKQAAGAAKELEGILNQAWNSKLGQFNLDKLNQSIKNSFNSVQGLNDALSKGGSVGQTAFNSVARSVLNTNVELKQTKTLLDDMAQSMANTVKWGITSSIFNNITGAIQSAYYYSKDLDRSLNNIRIVTGDSADEMQRFAKVANQTAKDLGRSTLDYTKAATSFYQQGLSENEVKERTRVTLMAQNITGGGSQVIDDLTAVWNGFKVTTENVQATVDKLAAVADSSASDMGQLATAMSKVAATANQMGVDVDQLSAQLATVIATTRQAPESVGTAFKTIYTRLNDIKTGADGAQISLGKYSGAMADLGFNVLDTNGNLRDTGEVIEQIGGRWDTLTKEQQVYLAQTMGGQRQITQLMALFENWNRYVDLLNVSLDSEGSLLEKNSVYMESTAAHLERLSAETQRTADILFDSDTINTFTDALNGALTLFNDFIAGVGGGIIAFTNLGSIVAGIFSKQIAGAINQAEQSLQRFLNNKRGDQLKAQFAQQITDQRVGAREYDTVNEQAISAAAQKEAEIYQKTLEVKKGLTAESEKELIALQKQIGINTAKIQSIKNYKHLVEDAVGFEEASVGYLKGAANQQKETINSTQTLVDLFEKLSNTSLRNKMSVQDVAKAFERAYDPSKLSNTETALGRIYQTLTGQGASLDLLEDMQADLDFLIKDQNGNLDQQKEKLQKILIALQAKKDAEAGVDKQLEKQNQALERQTNLRQQQARHLINIQNLVKGISAAGQILSSVAGNIKIFMDQTATSADKANAAFSTTQSIISSVGTAFGPVGMGIATLTNGVISLLRNVTPLGDWVENFFASSQDKIDKMNQSLEKVGDINKVQGKTISSLQAIVDQYEKLSEKAGAYGIHINDLTQEEKNRYHELTNTFTEYNKQVISGYDEQGNAIVSGQKALLDTIEILKQAKKQAATASMDLEDIFSGVDARHSREDIEEDLGTAQADLRNAKIEQSQWGAGTISEIQEYAQNSFLDDLDAVINESLDSETAQKVQEKIAVFKQTFANQIVEAWGAATTEEQVSKLKVALVNADAMVRVLNEYMDQETTAFDQFINAFDEERKAELDKIVADNEQIVADLQAELSKQKFYTQEDANAIIYIMQNYIGQDQQWEALMAQADKAGLSSGTIVKMLSSYIQTFDDQLKGREALEKTQSYAASLAEGLQNGFQIIEKTVKANKLDDFKGTIEEKQETIKNALESIFNSQAYQNLNRKGKQAFIDIIKQTFDLSDLKVSVNTGKLHSFTTETMDIVTKTLQQNIGQSDKTNGLVNQITEYLIGNFDQSKVLEITAAIGQGIAAFQSFDDFALWLDNYNKEISQTAEQSEEANKIVQGADKIVSSIKKLKEGKDLSQKDKKTLIEQLGISDEALKNLKTNVDWLDFLVNQINNIIDDDKRRQAIGLIYEDIQSLKKAFQNGQISLPDYFYAWNQLFEKQAESLGVNTQFLERYADVKGKAFNTQKQKEEVMNLYQQQQGFIALRNAIKGVSEDIKKGLYNTEVDNFITSFKELTGKDIDFTWLTNNIDFVVKELEDEGKNLQDIIADIEKFNHLKQLYDSTSNVAVKAAIYQMMVELTEAQDDATESIKNEKTAYEEFLDVLKQLGLSEPALEEYARLKHMAFDTQDEKDAAAALYKQQRAVSDFIKSLSSSKDSIKEIVEAYKTGISDFGENNEVLIDLKQQWDAITGQDLSMDQFIENLQQISQTTQEGQTNLFNYINTLAQLEQVQSQIKTLYQEYNNTTDLERQQEITQEILELQTYENSLLLQKNTLIKEETTSLTDNLNKIQESCDKLEEINNIRESLAKNGTISDSELKTVLQTIDQLVEDGYPNLIDNVEILNEKWLQGTDEYKQALDEVYDTLQTDIYNDLIDQAQEFSKTIDEAKSKIFDLNGEVKIDIDDTDLVNWMNSIDSYLNVDKLINIRIQTDAQLAVAELNNQIDQITDAASKIGENFIIAADDIMVLQSTFPGILQGMQTLDDGSLQLNQNMVERALETANTQIQTDKESLQAQLKNQAEILREKARSYEAMATAFQTLANKDKNTTEVNEAAIKQIQDSYNSISVTNEKKALDKKESFNADLVKNNAENENIISQNLEKSLQARIRGLNNFAKHVFKIAAQIARVMSEAQQGREANWYLPGWSSFVDSVSLSGGNSQGNVDSALDLSGVDLNNLSSEQAGRRAEEALAQAYALYGQADSLDALYALIGANASQAAHGLGNVSQGLGYSGGRNGSTSGSSGGRTGSSGGGSSGGGSGSSSDDELTDGTNGKNDPRNIEITSEVPDRYHDINIELEQINNKLKDLKNNQKNLEGQDLIDNLNQQLKILEQQEAAYKRKLALMRQEQKEVQTVLAGQGVTFDKDGRISNYSTIFNQKLAAIQSIQRQMQQAPSKDQQDALQPLLDKAKKEFENFKNLVSAYDKLITNGIPGLESAIQNINNEKKNIQDEINKPEEEEKDDRDFLERLEDEADRYHDINIELKQLSTALDRVKRSQDKLIGKDLLKNLDKQLKILEKQKDAQQRKLAIARIEAKELKGRLAGQGATFNSEGIITNYKQLLEQKLDELNIQIAFYNMATKEQQQKMKQGIEIAKKHYEELKDLIERYDQLMADEIPEIQDSIQDIANEQIEIQIDKFKVKIELELDAADFQKQFNEFRRRVVDRVSKDDILGNARSRMRDFSIYYNDTSSGGIISSLTDQVNGTLAELNAIDKFGSSSVYGDNKKQALEDLKQYSSQLMDNMMEVEDLIQDIKDSIFDIISETQKAFDIQLDKYDLINDTIEHGMQLTEMLYGDDAYADMNHFYEARNKNNAKQIDFLKQERDMWRSFMEQQSDPKVRAEFEQNWLDASKELNSVVEDAVQNLIDKYENAINQIFDDLEKKLTNGKSLDYISEEWELINRQADMYLDTVNSAFEIQKLQNAFEEAIDNNDGNLKAQQSLNNLMEQQLKYLKDKDKITQYDVDRANALLQIETKRLALENTRTNKSKLRLRRDSQGNYTYQYIADEEQISKARQELQQAEVDLYNMTKQAFIKNQQDFLNTTKDWQKAIKAVYEDTTLSAEQQQEKVSMLNQYYGAIINDQTALDADFRKFLMQDTFNSLASLYETDVMNFHAMAEEQKNTLMDTIIPQWEDGISTMMKAIVGQGGFEPAVEDAFVRLSAAVATYQKDLDQLAKIAETDFGNITDSVDKMTDSIGETIQANKDLIDTYRDEIFSIQGLIGELDSLIQKYREAAEAAMAAAAAANGYVQGEAGQTPAPSGGNASGSASIEGPPPGWDEGTPEEVLIGDDDKLTEEKVTPSKPSGSKTTTKKPVKTTTTKKPAKTTTKKPVVAATTTTTKNLGHSGSSSRILDDATIERIVAALWLDDGGWTVDPERGDRFVEKFGEDGAARITDFVNRQRNKDNFASLGKKWWDYQAPSKGGAENANGYLRNYYYSAFKTGGYTGSWGNTGKLGVLHEKELILNKEDTQNILSAVDIVRSINGLMGSIGNISLPLGKTLTNNSSSIFDQNVHITATFPAVNSQVEIENAFNNLINRASQYAFSKQR